MGDEQPIDKQLADYFRDELGFELSKDELLEIKQSLFYLGRAIYRYHLAQKGGGYGE